MTKDFLLSIDPKVAIALVIVLLAYALFRQMANLLILGAINKTLALLSQKRPRILNPGKLRSILLIGDSTAFGTGATNIDTTLAGRLARDFPEVEIINYAVNGAVTSDLMAQLDRVKDRQFDMILISAGGNDVWRFKDLRKSYEILCDVVSKARELSRGKVVLLDYNNIASAPAIPFFLRSSILERMKIMNNIIMTLSDDYHVDAVHMLNTENNNPFIKDPKTYFAEDGIHPSGEGYRLWYEELLKSISLYKYNLDH